MTDTTSHVARLKEAGYKAAIDEGVENGEFMFVGAIAHNDEGRYSKRASGYAQSKVESATGKAIEVLVASGKENGISGELAGLETIARLPWVPIAQRLQAVSGVTEVLESWVKKGTRDDGAIMVDVQKLDKIANEKKVPKTVRMAALDGVISVVEKWTALRRAEAQDMRAKHRSFVQNATFPDKRMNGKPLRY